MSNVDIYNNVSSNARQPVVTPSETCINVELQDQELWKKFSSAQTEMIVTKGGRRMFPGYRIKLEGLNPSAQYCVLMDVVSVDQHRYKFQQGEWVVAGRGEPQVPQRFYLHPNSPCNGAKWMNDILTFHKVKLTNSCGNLSNGKFFVHSMHRYQTRIHVVRTDDVSSLHLQPMSSFEFPQTKFITVTAYQNQEVTKLKIENNPFARGFRANGGKTKNFEMSSTSSCPKTKKRVTMGAAFQQIHKRWKNDATNPSAMTSCNSWSSYQPNRKISTANLLPSYYQPTNPNQCETIYEPRLSPNSCTYQEPVSSMVSPTSIYQPQLSHQNYINQSQVSPNQYYQPQFQACFQPQTNHSPNMSPVVQQHSNYNGFQQNQMYQTSYPVNSQESTRFPFPPVASYTNNVEQNQMLWNNYSNTNQYVFEPNLTNNTNNYQFTCNSTSPTLSQQSLQSPIFNQTNELGNNMTNSSEISPLSAHETAQVFYACGNKSNFRSMLPSTDDGYSSTSPLQLDNDVIDFDNLDDLL